jgi:hypothetical protein
MMLDAKSAFNLGGITKALDIIVLSHFRTANRYPLRLGMLYAPSRFSGQRHKSLIRQRSQAGFMALQM